MPRAKRKWREMKQAQKKKEERADYRYKAIIRKLTREYGRYAGKEDCRRGRLL